MVQGAVSEELREGIQLLHAASYRWALACCGRDRDEAEEVLQAAYVQILEGKARFEGRSTLKTWLFAVIYRTASSSRRKLFARLRLHSNLKREPARFDAHMPPPEILEQSERHAALRRALGTLSARQRETLELVFYQNFTIAEAASALGISVGSARVHYERGKANIFEALRAGGYL